MKVFIVCSVWNNTRDNHAGMYYLAKKIRERIGVPTELIALPTKWNRILFPVMPLLGILIGLYIRFKARSGDSVLLMEYLLPRCGHQYIAAAIGSHVRVFAIAHLVPELIRKMYSAERLKKEVSVCERVFVLGGNLKDCLVEMGVPADKVSVTFHYTDTEYYRPGNLARKDRLQVLCMGNMQRNYSVLADIIKKSPFVDFHVCVGMQDLSQWFTGFTNVSLHGYMDESELLELMQASDISLNVMNDTVGSNVITTSLAAGMAVLASDVGAIRDYISDGYDGLLFDTPEKASELIYALSDDRELLDRIRIHGREKALSLDLDKSVRYFAEYLL